MSFPQRVFYIVMWFALLSRVIFALYRRRSSETVSTIDTEELPDLKSTGLLRHEFRKNFIYVAWFILLLIVYRRGFSSQNIVGGDWGTWPVPSLSENLFPFPSLWNFNDLGSSNLVGAALYPLESIAGLFVRIGSSYGFAEHVLFFWPPILAFFTSGCIIGRKLGLGVVLSGAVGFLIAVSTPVGAFMAGGWFPILMGAALLVPIILLIHSAPKPQRTIEVGLLIGIDIWFDPRNTFILTLGLLAFLVIELIESRSIRRSLFFYVPLWPAALIALALQATWIIPLMLGARANLPAGYLTHSAAVAFSFNNLGNGMSWFNYAWPILHTGQVENIPPLLVVLPVLMFIGTLGRSLSKIEIWLLVVFLFTSFLAGGGNPPFGSIYVLMFTHIPGFDLYRDDSVYLPYCVVTSAVFVLFGLLKLSQFVIKSLSRLRESVGRYSSFLLAVSVCALVLVLSSAAALPISNGSVIGDIGSVNLSTADKQLNLYLVSHFGNNVWVPQVSVLAPRGSQLSPNLSSATLDDMLTKAFGLSNAASSLFWLNSIDDVRAVAQQYGIGHLIIDENSTDYASISEGNWILNQVVPKLERQYCATRRCPKFGPWVVIPISDADVVSSLVRASPVVKTSNVSSGGPESSLKYPLLLPSGFKLPNSLCFSESEINSSLWNPVGNVDNFQNLSGLESGLYERSDNQKATTLGIRSGAAAISRTINGCKQILRYSSADVFIVRVSFESSANATVNVNVSRRDQTTECQFDASTRIKTQSCLFSFPFTPIMKGQPLTAPTLTLGVAPINDPSPLGLASATYYSVKILVSPSSSKDSSLVTSSVRPVASLRAISNAGFQFEQLQNDHKRIVLYQSYDKNWVATIQQGHESPKVLGHFDALGWANGFRIPNGVKGNSLVTISYRLQDSLDLGMVVVAVVLVLSGLTLIVIRLRRRRLSGSTDSS
jgi:hypothetical protein